MMEIDKYPVRQLDLRLEHHFYEWSCIVATAPGIYDFQLVTPITSEFEQLYGLLDQFWMNQSIIVPTASAMT